MTDDNENANARRVDKLGEHKRRVNELEAAACESAGSAQTGGKRDAEAVRRAHEALRDSENRFKALFEQAGDYILVLEPDGKGGLTIIDANAAACSVHGYVREELVGSTLRNLDDSVDGEQIAERTRALLSGGKVVFETEHLRKDGTRFPVEVCATLLAGDPGPPQFISVERDITERRKTQDEREQYFRFFMLSNDPMCMADPFGCFKRVNPAFVRLTGYTESELVSRPFLDFVLPEDRQRTADEMELQVNIRPSLRFENRYVCKDGSAVFLAWTAYFDKNDGVTYACARDITESKKAEEVLRESEERFRMFAELAPQLVWMCRPDGWNIYFNQRWADYTGMTLEESHGHGWNKPFHPDDQQRAWDAWKQATEAGGTYDVECRLRRADGTYHWFIIRGLPWRDAAGRVVRWFGTCTDIDDRKQLEQQLRQAQKMEAVGQLAGGIAHDFNNLLQVIAGYSESIQQALPAGSALREDIGEVVTAADRAAELTRQLLAFSRRQAIHPVITDLNDLIEGVLKMVRRVIGEHIELIFAPENRLDAVSVDKGQIEQVLMNLCVNARDAMARGGTLTIQTGDAAFDAGYCHGHPWAVEGRYALMSVADTGHGMDAGTLARIFEPFFTTKGVGEGTGLGLATVYGIVKQHKGLVDVQSVPGRGTVFKVYLPTVARAAEQTDTPAESTAVGGTETILVAEDEPAVRSLVARILLAAGYSVLTAADGDEALRVFQEHADTINLLILDVMMPGLGGRQVMEKIQAKRAGVPFLFSSGYSENAIHKDFVIQEGLRLIQKPYRQEDLLREVRQILDARSENAP